MRPESLNILFSSLGRLKGVGESTLAALHKLLPAGAGLHGGTPVLRDLLFHLPVNIVDRRHTGPLSQAVDGQIGTFVVRVDLHQPPPGGKRGRRPYKVICSDEAGGTLELVFFHAQTDYIRSSLPAGSRRVISGRCERFDFRLQMTHPDIIAPAEKLAEVLAVEPVYPLTLGLTSRRIAGFVAQGLAKLPDLPEWLAPCEENQDWPRWKAALTQAHRPQSLEELSPLHPARARLAYDEMLARQLYFGMRRMSNRQQQARAAIKGGEYEVALRAKLPFALTQGQEAALSEIVGDMASGTRMTRLLQGDVGSGKTVVAMLAMLSIVQTGAQGALMVPTEVIAQQHYSTISKWLALIPEYGLRAVLLTGSVKGRARQEALAAIASGKAHIVIGTHALFQDQVEFADLGFIAIDEQHRFGVNQRMALSAKGEAPHILHMTATPIPRSLTMTLYGDMDCSTLREKPAGRQPIATRVIPLSRYEDIMQRLHGALERGEKVYWICPLIEGGEEESEDIAAAQTRFTEFTARFGNRVGLMHGRMKAAERDEQMRAFARGDTRLLVATTVVEVGVDVPDATIIVIEKAERFGLSQLHQLRGRVGRGNKPSACVLLYTEDSGAGIQDSGKDAPANAIYARLSILRESEDGFRIAEADLSIRGSGDTLGTRQSGMPRFCFIDMRFHAPMQERARQEAQNALVSGAVSDSLKTLLALFSFDSE